MTRGVSWTDDDGRRHLRRLFALLAVLAGIAHFLGPWMGLA